MVQPNVHLAFDPQGGGLRWAVLWFRDGADVLGWYIGASDADVMSAYFKLEDFHSAGGGRFLHSAEGLVHGPWFEAGAHGDVEVPHPPPLTQALCHELSRLQETFARHWLFFADDPSAPVWADALRRRGLPVRAVNLRPDRLGALDQGGKLWRHDGPGAETAVLAELSRHWALVHRVAA